MNLSKLSDSSDNQNGAVEQPDINNKNDEPTVQKAKVEQKATKVRKMQTIGHAK